ncbi:hypothetical protein GGF37_001712 [Kickxella alabastrina]|nr:hypothetical protein GGF37_001712 [Kickxella alabastrina]
MLDIDHSKTTAGTARPRNSTADRTIYRQSWSSDEPPLTATPTKEAKGLWSRLRKQASRIQTPQLPHSPSVDFFSSKQPENHSLSSINLAPIPTTSSSGSSSAAVLAERRPDLSRVSMSHGRKTPMRSNSYKQQGRNLQSLDIPRTGVLDHGHSLDLRRTPNHWNPEEITAESIRMTLGAYTGKTEDSRPSLRRLLMPERNRPIISGAAVAADLALLARITEDDENAASGAAAAAAAAAANRYVFADAKRFSENSGFTVSSNDTTLGDQTPEAARLRSPGFGTGGGGGSVTGRPVAIYEDDGALGDASSGGGDYSLGRSSGFAAQLAAGPPNSAGGRRPPLRALTKTVSEDTLHVVRNIKPFDEIKPVVHSVVVDKFADVKAAAAAMGMATVVERPGTITSESGANTPTDRRFSVCSFPDSVLLPPRPRSPIVEPEIESRSVVEPTVSGEPVEPIKGSPAEANMEYLRGLQADIDALRSRTRRLEAENDILVQLTTVDPMDSMPEGVKMRLRTLELENVWLRGELRRRK